jgi:5-methylcytosine-specific restriction endonuclease McrA
MAQPTVLPRSCTQDGCDRAHRAKGLCSTHYNQAMQPNRHKVIAAQCVVCGVEVSGKYQSGARQYVCSTECRWWINPQSVLSLPLPRTHRAHPDYKAELVLYVAPPVKAPRPRVWVAGACAWCGDGYVVVHQLTARYCSDPCMKKQQRQEYRARKHKAFVARVSPNAIYVRDAWTCQLCMQPVDRDACVPDPRAPTLDHVLALANGGTHEPSNVQLACFRCNCIKGDR